MSNSNRPDNKSPNPKLARYLHRIQQLVGNRGRTPSPIGSRINKPIKPNSLDHYLKYELTFKILCGFFDKNNKVYMRNFFNNLRTCQNSKVEKIYKFVPIQKTQCAHMIVDSGISTRMLVNVLKTKLKSQLKCGFDAIKNSQMVDSNIMSARTGKSHVSNRSNITHLTTQHKKKHSIQLILHTFFIAREASVFHIIKSQYLKQKWQNQQKNTIKISENANSYIIPKLKLMEKTLKRIQEKRLYLSFGKIKDFYYQNVILENKYLHSLQKFKLISKNYFTQKKIQLLWGIEQLKFKIKNQQIQKLNQIIREHQMKNQKNEQIKQGALSLVGANNIYESSSIFEAVNRINSGLISIIIRRKMDVMNILQRSNTSKKQKIHKMVNVLGKKVVVKLLSGFQKLLQNKLSIEIDQKSVKSTKVEKASSKQSINWRAIASLNNMSELFLPFLFDPFNRIKSFSLASQEKNQSIKKIQNLCNLIIAKEGFYKLKKYNQYQKINQSLEKERQQLSRKQKQFLPKTLCRIAISNIADSFIKIKYQKRKPPSNKNNRKSDWIQDIQNFLEERDKFNKVSIEKITKIEQLVIKNSVEEPNGQGLRPAFSPTRNKNSTLFVK